MKMRFIYLLALSGLMLGSCSKDSDNNKDEDIYEWNFQIIYQKSYTFYPSIANFTKGKNPWEESYFIQGEESDFEVTYPSWNFMVLKPTVPDYVGKQILNQYQMNPNNVTRKYNTVSDTILKGKHSLKINGYDILCDVVIIDNKYQYDSLKVTSYQYSFQGGTYYRVNAAKDINLLDVLKEIKQDTIVLTDSYITNLSGYYNDHIPLDDETKEMLYQKFKIK